MKKTSLMNRVLALLVLLSIFISSVPAMAANDDAVDTTIVNDVYNNSEGSYTYPLSAWNPQWTQSGWIDTDSDGGTALNKKVIRLNWQGDWSNGGITDNKIALKDLGDKLFNSDSGKATYMEFNIKSPWLYNTVRFRPATVSDDTVTGDSTIGEFTYTLNKGEWNKVRFVENAAKNQMDVYVNDTLQTVWKSESLSTCTAMIIDPLTSTKNNVVEDLRVEYLKIGTTTMEAADVEAVQGNGEKETVFHDVYDNAEGTYVYPYNNWKPEWSNAPFITNPDSKGNSLIVNWTGETSASDGTVTDNRILLNNIGEYLYNSDLGNVAYIQMNLEAPYYTGILKITPNGDNKIGSYIQVFEKGQLYSVKFIADKSKNQLDMYVGDKLVKTWTNESLKDYTSMRIDPLSDTANSEIWFLRIVDLEAGAYVTKPTAIEITNGETAAITEPGGTLQLTATVTPAEASSKEITWSTDNDEVATVSTSGLVTAVGNGKANITATSKYNENIKDSIEITVSGQSTTDKTKLRVLLANQKNGVIAQWEGTQAISDNYAKQNEAALKAIKFEDGSFWGRIQKNGDDWSSGSNVGYAYDSDSQTVKAKMNMGNTDWPNAYFGLGSAVSTANVKRIIIGVKSDRDIENFRMWYHSYDEENCDNRYDTVNLKQGFHEYTIYVSASTKWKELSSYNYFQFDYDQTETNLEFAYIRFVDDTYVGRSEDDGNGTWLENGAVNYNPDDTVVDIVLPNGKFFKDPTANPVQASQVKINNQPVKWVLHGGTSGRIRVNLGKLNANTDYTISFDGVKDTNDALIEDTFTFKTGGVTFEITSENKTITTENGTLTLSPKAVKDGVEVEDYSSVVWAVDSANATATVDNDKKLTLTGKMNGNVNVTAYFTLDGVQYKATSTVAVSGQNEATVPTKTIKVMAYGNSILKHEPNESLGWKGNWGMAASSEDKDYIHRLISMLGDKYGKNNVSLVSCKNVSSFESAIQSGTDSTDYSEQLADISAEVKAGQPDIVTVQIGENAGAATEAVYKNALKQFVQTIKTASPNTLVLVTTPFWGGDGKISGAKAVAAEFNLPIANLEQFNTNENKAYDGDGVDANWNEGVKAHPGNLGMEHIAGEMFEQLNKCLTGNDNITYGTKPSAITITNGESAAITTLGGTLQLTTTITPENSESGILWTTSSEAIATVDENGLVTAKNNGTVTITATSKYDDSVKATIEITVSGQNLPTLTFDKNTTDEVTNMPESGEVMAGEVSLAGKYPFRETYTFVGWSLTANGDVVSSVNVSEDTTLYAIWKKATAWTFDRDGYQEGFTVENGFNVEVKDGIFKALETGYSETNILKIKSPKLDINSSDYAQLKIKMQNTVFDENTKLGVTIHTTNGDVKSEYAVTTTDQTTYTVSLDNVTGTITGFELVPTNMDATINIDDISFEVKTVDTSKVRLLLPDQTTGVQNRWEGTQTLATEGNTTPEEYAKRIIKFEDGSWWGWYKNGADATADCKTEYAFDSNSHRMKVNMNVGNANEWANTFYHMDKPVSSATTKNIVIGLNSSRDISDFRVWFYNSSETQESEQPFKTVDIKKGYHEYTIDVAKPGVKSGEKSDSKVIPWNDHNTYDYLKFDYDDQQGSNVVTNLEFSYIRFVDDTYVGRCEDDGDGTWIENGAVNYNVGNSIVDIVLPNDKHFNKPDVNPIQANQVKINGKSVEWVQSGKTWQRIRVNLGKLESNTKYTISIEGIGYLQGGSIEPITFTTGNTIEYSDIQVLKNGTAVTSLDSVNAGDTLQVKISNLHNNSSYETDLSIIPSIYTASGLLGNVNMNEVKLDGGQTISEKTFDVTVPSDIQNIGKISVFVWSGVAGGNMKPEVSNYYKLTATEQ